MAQIIGWFATLAAETLAIAAVLLLAQPRKPRR